MNDEKEQPDFPWWSRVLGFIMWKLFGAIDNPPKDDEK